MKEIYYNIKYWLQQLLIKPSYLISKPIIDRRTISPINWKVWNRWYSRRREYSYTNVDTEYVDTITQHSNGILLESKFKDNKLLLQNLYSYSKTLVGYGLFEFTLSEKLPSDNWETIIELSSSLGTPAIYFKVFKKNSKYFMSMDSVTGSLMNNKLIRIFPANPEQPNNLEIEWTPDYIEWKVNSKVVHRTFNNIPTNKLAIRLALQGKDTCNYKNNETAFTTISDLTITSI